METLELTTEFGTLNFEDIAEEITEAPVKEPEIVIENDSEFEKEMEKVIGIMKIAGDDLPVSTIKTLMTDLVLKAKNESEIKQEEMDTKQKEEERLDEVTTLVNLFKGNVEVLKVWQNMYQILIDRAHFY